MHTTHYHMHTTYSHMHNHTTHYHMCTPTHCHMHTLSHVHTHTLSHVHTHTLSHMCTPCTIEGFGNATRIDYGTGHEAKFMAFLCCLMKIGVILKEDAAAVVLRVVKRWGEGRRGRREEGEKERTIVVKRHCLHVGSGMFLHIVWCILHYLK